AASDRCPGRPLRGGCAMKSFLDESHGWRSWLLTKDHKRIGLMFLVVVTISLLLGGVFAMILRFELLTPGESFLDSHTYNQMFTHHGVAMVFLFMIPGIPTVFGN